MLPAQAPGQRVEGELAERLLQEIRSPESRRQLQSSSQSGRPSTSNKGANTKSNTRKGRWAQRRAPGSHASEDLQDNDTDDDGDSDDDDGDSDDLTEDLFNDEDEDEGPAQRDEDDIMAYKQRVVALLQHDDENVLQALR